MYRCPLMTDPVNRTFYIKIKFVGRINITKVVSITLYPNGPRLNQGLKHLGRIRQEDT